MFPFRCQNTCEQTIYISHFSRRRNRKRLAPLCILMFCLCIYEPLVPVLDPLGGRQTHPKPTITTPWSPLFSQAIWCWLMQSHPSPFRVPPRGSSRLGRLALERHHDPQLRWSCPAVSGSEAVGRRATRSHPKGVLNAPNASPQAISKGIRDESTVIGGCSMFTEWEVTGLKRYQRPHQPHNLHLNEYLQTAPNSHLDRSFRHLQ